jgi:hypothetical protein
MRCSTVSILVITVCLGSACAEEKDSKKGERKNSDPVSFAKMVFPIIKKNCLPCHAEENFNPSELSLDSYDQLIAGGKHGVPVVPGKSKESILFQKLGSTPPFGDPMPLDPKKKKGETSKKSLTADEIKTIADWIDHGAKKD